MPQDIGNDWKKWSNQLNLLKNLHISRCFKPPKFGRIKETSIHHFSDASDSGYGQEIQKELQLLNVKETFWTDSEVVLGYIRNESRKFKVFVADRTEMIRNHTDIHQ